MASTITHRCENRCQDENSGSACSRGPFKIASAAEEQRKAWHKERKSKGLSGRTAKKILFINLEPFEIIFWIFR